MKELVLFLIDVYQKIFSYVLKNIVGTAHVCRFDPTCSEYAKLSIKKSGVLKGFYLTFFRLLKCQPFYKEQRI